MFYFDKRDDDVLFGDIRSETLTVRDSSQKSGARTLHIHPDVQMDFRALPFHDATFPCVIFDPPHLVRVGKSSWLAAKYGRLSENFRDDIRAGFAECFRVLRNDGVLIFKWSERDVPTKDIVALAPKTPVLWQKTSKLTHWMVFIK